MTALYDAYKKSPALSIKYDGYFPVYEKLLQNYRGKAITLVEVGVFNGGSLFMWRQYFGEQARVIGIDLNPDAQAWEDHGFEIYIGDQSKDLFWIEFFSKVGNVDVFIDDGGHTNSQQITTVHHAIQNINDGGILIVEDTHTSYLREFGNPSRYSFLNFAHRIVDSVNSRSFCLKRAHSKYSSHVHSVHFYESIVAFNIDSSLCRQSLPTSNNGASRGAADFRYQGFITSTLFGYKNKFASKRSLGAKLTRRAIDVVLSFISKLKSIQILKYFRDES